MSILSPCYTSPAAAPPLECDDLLSEILLRLPPQPSSLPLASLVCRRWRSIASDAGFSRRFRRRLLPPLPPPPPPQRSSPPRHLPPRYQLHRLPIHHGAPQLHPAWPLLHVAGRPLPLPRMPPWPRANIPEDAESGPGVGPGRRRPAQLSRAPGD